MTTLPVDVITDILLRLPAKSLLRFKCVCKLWYDIIEGTDFIKRHVEQSNLHMIFTNPVVYMSDFDKFDKPTNLDYPFKNLEDGGVYVEGSSRGLLCISINCYPYTTYLYNPTTQSYKTLPFLPLMSTFYYPKGNKYLGFGYDHVSEDYKCVKIFLRELDGEVGSFKSQVMIYSLREDSWKRGAHDVPYYFYGHFGYSVELNGILHWSIEGNHREPLPIVTFNLCDETFCSVPLPNYHTEIYMRAHIGVIDVCLCLILNYYCYCEVWVMKEYGVASSWTKLCRVGKRYHYEDLRPISFSESKKELLVISTLVNVASLDLETLEITNIQPPGFNRFWSAHVCLENLLVFRDVEDAPTGTELPRSRSIRMRKLLMKKTERLLRIHATRLQASLELLRSSNDES
ncbi:F-box protein CPR30-like [Chenopodium quinoa]|uniref:F-box domain-containing protein n=1 Tax=Chenopodium quinoa TaxID=63459 RepID=A0A803MBW8_CHEQI|nr:F-box protein CPR30-like [Chenopodium quinoa]